jgi:hypothetical protein
MDYQELLNNIKNEFPDKAIDIIEGLELLRMLIDDTVETIGEKVNESFVEKQYDKLPYYSKLAEEMVTYEKKLKEVIDILDIEDLELEGKKEADEEKEIPDYNQYTVDKNIEYSLYENFTHKRPYAFKLLDDRLIRVKTWQEMLIKVCENLMKVDNEKIIRFEELEHMNGKKKKYFSSKSKGMRNPKRVANKIYVETNQSANSIRNLLIKILKEYGLKTGDLKIYLRADYTEINKDKVKNN